LKHPLAGLRSRPSSEGERFERPREARADPRKKYAMHHRMWWRTNKSAPFKKTHAAGGGVAVQPETEPARRWCHWPFRTHVLTSDGDVVCGCADPFKQHPLGSMREQTLM